MCPHVRMPMPVSLYLCIGVHVHELEGKNTNNAGGHDSCH